MKFVLELVVRLIAYVMVALALRKQGKDGERLKAKEEQIDAVKEANDVRDRLERDPEYAQRVRDRFSRD